MKECVFLFQAEDGIRDVAVTGVQTCALPICKAVSATFLPGTALHARTALDGPRGSGCTSRMDRWHIPRCIRGSAFRYGLDRWRMGRWRPSFKAKSLARAGSRRHLLCGLAGELRFEPYPMGPGRICGPQWANGADCRRRKSHDVTRPQSRS